MIMMNTTKIKWLDAIRKGLKTVSKHTAIPSFPFPHTTEQALGRKENQ